jgi:hypothetical protein
VTGERASLDADGVREYGSVIWRLLTRFGEDGGWPVFQAREWIMNVVWPLTALYSGPL